jgi:hypothetical protein
MDTAASRFSTLFDGIEPNRCQKNPAGPAVINLLPSQTVLTHSETSEFDKW